MVIDNHAHHVSTVMMFPVSEILEKRFSCASLFQNEYSAYVAGVSTEIGHVILLSMKIRYLYQMYVLFTSLHSLSSLSFLSLSPSLPLFLPLFLLSLSVCLKSYSGLAYWCYRCTHSKFLHLDGTSWLILLYTISFHITGSVSH